MAKLKNYIYILSIKLVGCHSRNSVTFFALIIKSADLLDRSLCDLIIDNNNNR